jgi:hypothetical protein
MGASLLARRPSVPALRAIRYAGDEGFADVWYKDCSVVEYKGKQKDLSAVYQRLLQYRGSLENPPLLVVTDTYRFEVHTNSAGTVSMVCIRADTPQAHRSRDRSREARGVDSGARARPVKS